MKEALKTNSTALVTLTTVLFAGLVWLYVPNGYVGDTTYLVVAGICIVALDAIILWVIATTKVINKKRKGKK